MLVSTRASAKFMDMGPETGVTLKISSVSVKFTLTQVNYQMTVVTMVIVG